jgi:hypothetical protein
MGVVDLEHIRADGKRDSVPSPLPSAQGHSCVAGRTGSPPSPSPKEEGGGVTGKGTLSPPVPPTGGGGHGRASAEVAAGPAGPARAAWRGGRGGRWEDPTRTHGPWMRSGEGQAARRGEPRRRRRALAERSGDEMEMGRFDPDPRALDAERRGAAARLGGPRRRRRALAERSRDGPARGPAPEGQTEPEEQLLQGVSAEGQPNWVG